MTIASIASSGGGTARSVPLLVEALSVNLKCDVQLFLDEWSISKSIPSKNLVIKNIRGLNSEVKITFRESENNAIIHNNGIWLSINHRASVVARRYKVPIIISTRGMLEPWARNFHWFKKTIAWHCYQFRDLKHANVLHATSLKEARNLRKLKLNAPIAIIPNGTIVPDEPKHLITNGNSQKYALFLSRIHPIKGLMNLVKAWQQVCPDNWRVVVAGPDEIGHQKEVMREIESSGLSEHFSFVGEIGDNEKWDLYKEADLFILPTLSENFGIVVAEALACGTPVITTKGAPWADLKRYKCGWWVDNDINALSTAISEAVSLSDVDRYSMGANGRKLVIEKYSWSKIAEEMSSVYSWVVKGGSPPNCIMLPR